MGWLDVYVIGTAGHVDHGKSTLVQALTGIDPDRLQEEKARGMTIDLGFAWLTLPGGAEVSIVDVPGHERFIKNMLAGVGGIDLALLVIAADEGVMPQTREHLAIIDLLQIRAGLVAITKSDLVDEEWLALVMADVEETLAGTVLAGAELIACSATSGAGLPALRAAIERVLSTTEPKRDIGRPRLPIDRAFTVAGFGTVVTGTLIDGSLRSGQEVIIEPGGARSRIRGLQSHRHKLENAQPGSRVAVNLAGVAVEEVHRGQVLTVPGWLRPTTAIDVSLRAVAGAEHPIRHNASVTLHTGAAEVEARVRLLDRAELPPSEHGWAQVRLAEPAAIAPGDSFVLRSPNETLGGGQVVDVHARRHRRYDEATLGTLAALAEGSPEDVLFTLIDRLQPVDLAALIRQGEGGEAATRELVERLVGADRVIAIPPPPLSRSTVLFTSPGLDGLWQRVARVLSAYLAEYPLRSGMPREELRSRLGLTAKVFTDLLAGWTTAGQLVERSAALSFPGYTVTLTPAQQHEADTFCRSLLVNRYAPVLERMPDAELLHYLVEQGRVVAVSEGIIFDAVAFAEMVEQITAHLREERTITLAQVRDRFGASRKYAQALLEFLDSRGVTRRVGDERVLRL